MRGAIRVFGRRRLASYFGLALWLGAIAAARPIAAQPAPMPRPPRTSAPVASPREQVVLLRNDTVLRGQVASEADYYRIQIGPNEVRMPSREVVLVADNLLELYQFKQSILERRTTTDEPTMGTARAKLAHWCMRQGLRQQAIIEIGRARVLDPDNAMASVVETQLLSDRTVDVREPSPPEEVSRAPDSAGHATTSRLLGVDPRAQMPLADRPNSGEESPPTPRELDAIARDMPRDTMRIFGETVQPLLTNSCGTADCHGPRSDNGFRITPSHAGMPVNHLLTKRNLYQTLQWIDRSDPKSSPLLLRPIEAHGGAKEPAFTMRHLAQYRELARWVFAVCENRTSLSRLSSIGYDASRSRTGDSESRGTVQTPAFDATLGAAGPTVPTPQQRMLQQLRGGPEGEPSSPRSHPGEGAVDPALFFAPGAAHDARANRAGAGSGRWAYDPSTLGPNADVGAALGLSRLPMDEISENPFGSAGEDASLEAGGPRRGAQRDIFVPRDPFDAMQFNRRFFPKRAAETASPRP